MLPIDVLESNYFKKITNIRSYRSLHSEAAVTKLQLSDKYMRIHIKIPCSILSFLLVGK